MQSGACSSMALWLPSSYSWWRWTRPPICFQRSRPLLPLGMARPHQPSAACAWEGGGCCEPCASVDPRVVRKRNMRTGGPLGGRERSRDRQSSSVFLSPLRWRAHPSRPAPQGPRRSTPPSRLRSRSRSRTSRRLPCSSTRVSARAVHHPCPAELSTTMLILFCRALLGRYSVGPRVGQVRQLRHQLDHVSAVNMPVLFFLLVGAIVSARGSLFASLNG